LKVRSGQDVLIDDESEDRMTVIEEDGTKTLV